MKLKICCQLLTVQVNECAFSLKYKFIWKELPAITLLTLGDGVMDMKSFMFTSTIFILISTCCALESWWWDRHWQVYTSVCSEKVRNGSSPFTSKSQTLATGSASFNVNSQPQTLLITVNTAITSSHFLLCKWPLTTSSCNNTINDQKVTVYSHPHHWRKWIICFDTNLMAW